MVMLLCLKLYELNKIALDFEIFYHKYYKKISD
jgi:hypothetical protein